MLWCHTTTLNKYAIFLIVCGKLNEDLKCVEKERCHDDETDSQIIPCEPEEKEGISLGENTKYMGVCCKNIKGNIISSLEHSF